MYQSAGAAELQRGAALSYDRREDVARSLQQVSLQQVSLQRPAVGYSASAMRSRGAVVPALLIMESCECAREARNR
jgi:hypothetical protein